MPGELAEFRDFLRDFTRDLTAEYVERVLRGPRLTESKVVNDSLWGTITLRAIEAILLDSPLYQRLRLIRQLGVAHYVYPGATHARLEHSLGALHQASIILDSLKRSTPAIAPYLTDDWTNAIRVAALSHDLGHGLMSHVSEHAAREHFDSERLESEFAAENGLEKARLSEIAAFYIIDSEPYRALFAAALQAADDHIGPPDPIEVMKKAIIGLPIHDNILQLYELISGPFDVDKLDYMPRDAGKAGVPVVTDIPRLIGKIQVVQKERTQLPTRYARAIQERGQETFFLIGIGVSGARTLDELLFGRILLHDKIYRHHKVRAAESMVGILLKNLAAATAQDGVRLAYELVDDDLLRLERESQESFNTGTEDEKLAAAHSLAVAQDYSKRLRERHVLGRCYAYATSMPSDPYKGTPTQRMGLVSLATDMNDQGKRADLVTAIADSTLKILDLTGHLDLIDDLPGKDLTSYLAINPPDDRPEAGDVTRALLIDRDRDVFPFRQDGAQAKAWADAYLLFRDTGYVFGPKELSPYVFLAAARVLREQYGLRTPRSMYGYAKVGFYTTRDVRRQLGALGFYEGAPRDLRPLPAALETVDIGPRLSAMQKTFAGYQGPTDDRARSEEGGTLLEGRILDWAAQFEADELAVSALELVGKTRFLNRADVVGALVTFLDEHGEFKGGFICRLGEARDSSSITTYFAEDAAVRYDLTIVDLERALSTPKSPIILTDDFIGSGQQAISILEALLGVQPTNDLHEDRGRPLSAELAEELKQRPIALVFAAGDPDGVAALQSRAQALGMDATVYAHTQDVPRAFTPEPAAESAGARFRDRCAAIGEQLLLDEDAGHDESWAADRALGYGNDGYLLVLPYNTPAQTLTCLWASGIVDGLEWTPLFPRRKKR